MNRISQTFLILERHRRDDEWTLIGLVTNKVSRASVTLADWRRHNSRDYYACIAVYEGKITGKEHAVDDSNESDIVISSGSRLACRIIVYPVAGNGPASSLPNHGGKQ